MAASNSFSRNIHWWNAEEGDVAQCVFDTVGEIERRQSSTFDRFVRMEALYDPNGPAAQSGEGERNGRLTENEIASNCDTATAHIATVEVRARFMTDGADWSTQRRAKHLEWYCEGIGKLLDVHPKCTEDFLECTKKGTGINKVTERLGVPCVDPVMVDDIVVDDNETANGGPPRTMHHILRNADKEELKAQFPDFEQEIEDCTNDRRWRLKDHRGYEMTGIVVIESWRLPIGKKGAKNYRPGRHTIVINNTDLLDEPYHKPFFPFAVLRYTKRKESWYGIGLAERIAGHQRTLNKRNYQIERILDAASAPPTYVSMADQHLSVRDIHVVGPSTIIPIKGNPPVTPQVTMVNAETYNDRDRVRASAAEETGINRMAMHGTKPGGLESGAALREYRDQTTARFAVQEKNYERFVLDTFVLILDVCKDLGEQAPVITRRSKFGKKKIEWSEVDMGDVRVQIAASSALPRTPAGRMQQVLEWAQAGLVTQDEARDLIDHPDLERSISLFTSDLEGVEEDLEAIMDGKVVIPEPFDNHQLCVKRGTQQYRLIRDAGPEEVDGGIEEYEAVLEGIRQYIVNAANYLAPAPANEQMMPGASPLPMDPSMPAPPMDPSMMDPAMMAGPVQGAAPIAALAPQAMNLRAV